MRTIALSLAALALTTAPVKADTIPQYFGLDGAPYPPGEYKLNTPFTFDLRAPGLAAFTDFSLELLVETDSVDPVSQLVPLTVLVERPPGYAFGSAGTFTESQVSTPGNSQLAVTIGGASGGAGVTTVAGVNDAVARLTVTPTGGYGGEIRFTINGATFNALSESGGPIQPPDPVSVFLEDPGTPPASPVPGPGGVVLMGLGGVLLIARGRVLRRA